MGESEAPTLPCQPDSLTSLSDSESSAEMADSNFNSRGIGMRVQKKILGKMASKNVVKIFIDDTAGHLLDNLYRMSKDFKGNKKEAEKMIKNIIKIVIKIGILYRNEQFNKDELILAEQFKKKFRSTAMTIISFYEVDYSFDKNFLSKSLNECSAMLKQLIHRHLTDKSISRVDQIFHFLGNIEFLEAIFKPNSQYQQQLGLIVTDMHKMMEEEP